MYYSVVTWRSNPLLSFQSHGLFNVYFYKVEFSFSSDGNGTDVGDLTTARGNAQSASSSTAHGYTNGGNSSNVIDKYPFSSDANATDVGNLTNSTAFAATGQQV